MSLVKMWCLAAFVAAPFTLDAANADVKRIEIEKESTTDFESCMGIGKEGLILVTKDKANQQNVKKDHDRFTFTKYDTLLNKVTSVDAEFLHEKNGIIDFHNQFFRSLTKDNGLYKIAMEKNGNYEVLHIDGKSMQPTLSAGKVGNRSELGLSQVLGDYVYMSGTQKGEPFVYALNLKTGVGKIHNIKVQNKRHFGVMSLEVDEEQNEVQYLVKEQDGKGYVIKLYVFVDGEISNQITLAPSEKGKYPATAFASKMSDGNYIISGTYSAKDTKDVEASVGIFLQRVVGGKTISSTYINYLDLKNFTSGMSERQLKKIEKKKAKKAENNEEYTIDYNMLPYRVMEENGKYLLVGEAYIPTYAVQQVSTVSSNGSINMVSQVVFDGWKYTRYFIIEFDQQGQVLWNTSAPLEVNKSWTVRRHLALNKVDNTLEIFYPSFGHMNHVTYTYGSDELKTEEIPFIDAKLKSYSGLNTFLWYDNTFLSTANLKFKDDNGKHKIYSINRITCGK